MKYLKRFLSMMLASAMVSSAVPALAFDLADSAAEDAAKRLIESRKYFYNPSDISLASENEYPETFDLRNADLDGSGVKKNYVTPVKNQGFLGTCWGFAATAAAETSILTDLGMSYDEWNKSMPWEMDLSEHHLAWFANNALPEDFGDQGGEGIYFTDPDISSSGKMDKGGGGTTATSIYSAGIGPMLEEQFPYRGKEETIVYRDPETGKNYLEYVEGFEPYLYSPFDDWSIDEQDRFGQVYPLEESFMLPSPAQFEYDETEKKYNYVYNQAGTDAIKEQLMKGRAVHILYAADTSSEPEKSEHHNINPASWAHYTPLSNKEDSENGEHMDHAVMIVGWDDSFPKENFFEEPPGNGAWIVKNSWGSDESEFPNKNIWGDHGYFYLSYYDHTLETPEAFDFDVTPDESASGAYRSFKYDYMPVYSSYKNNVFDEPTSMANTFKNDDVDLTAKTLTFYTELPGTETTFEIYMLSDQSASPTDGELVASGKKTYEYGGYHRFDLEEPVYIPANAKFSVVVTNKTADGKYEITNQEFPSEICMRSYEAVNNAQSKYAKGVVNEGESFIKTTSENNEAEWADWGETIAADKEISEAYLEQVGFMDVLAQTEDALKAYNSVVEYYNAHPEEIGEGIPADLETAYNQWRQKSVVLDAMMIVIMSGNPEALGMAPEDASSFSDAAFYARDNFPITVIADAAIKDHILYYDSATSKLYTKMDYDTKEFSEPIDSFPGAICEGNKLTLTSDFQFVTTAKDGLFIDSNTTLYVPEGEHPSILSAAGGFTGDDKLNEYTGIFAADGSTIDIDGTLTVQSGTGTDASGRAILSDGDLKITGKGSLEAICGDTKDDEAAESGRWDSFGIYIYGDLDISVANARFIGGDAYGLSHGILTDPEHSVTIGEGASVTAQSGENRGEGDFYDRFYSYACVTSYLTVKDNSSFVASATGGEEDDVCGLIMICGEPFGNGTIYNGGITLKNNSSIIVSADGSDRGVGISHFPNAVLPVEMDSTCTFIAAGEMKASGADLVGVTATSADGEVLAYTRGTDKLTNSYVDTDGNIAKYIEFKNSADVAEGDKILYFDGETGTLYSKYDFHTGEKSDPVEVPGAICEQNKLTLTSDFRFVTTHEDGLYMSAGSTLYVPEGEAPYIKSAAAGFTRNDTSICTSGINVRGDLTLDIDGTLTVISGDGVNVDSFGVACEGNLTITGKGTLNAFGGNTSYDESEQDAQTDSDGILVYKNIDISNAEVNAYGGDAYEDSEGIATWPGGSLTISGGAQVKAEGGSTADTEFVHAAIGCEVSEIVIKDNSSLTASAVSNKGILNVGLNMNSEAADDNGTTYNGRIKLENNSTLKVRAANTECKYGIYQADGPFEGPIKTEMDDTCTFTSDAGVAGFANLKGVTAISDGEVVTFDGEIGCYADEDGNPIKNLSFRPSSAEPTQTPEASAEPIQTPEATAEPTATPAATAAPTTHGGGGFKPSSSAATPTASPAPTTEPTAAPAETTAPEATAAPAETTAPAATQQPEPTAAPSTGSLPFTDVKPTDWFYNAVKAAYTEGLINGVTDTEFAPDATLTRGMLVTIVGRMGAAETTKASPFTDVDANAYYAPYVAWAAENGIVTGYGEGIFRPEENVTREQTAAILYRYMKNYIGADVSIGENTNILSYPDAADISEYAVPAIQWACGAGVIKGYPDGTLAPKSSITRAEFTSMISAISLSGSDI